MIKCKEERIAELESKLKLANDNVESLRESLETANKTNSTLFKAGTAAGDELAATKEVLRLKELELNDDSEWKNGDKCIYDGKIAIVIGYHPSFRSLVVVISEAHGGLIIVCHSDISRPLTDEQKRDKELDDLDSAVAYPAKFNRKELIEILYDKGIRAEDLNDMNDNGRIRLEIEDLK